MAEKKKTRKQQGRAEFKFTSGYAGDPFVDTEGTFADGRELLPHRDDVGNAAMLITIITRSGRKKVVRDPIPVEVGSTVTITYG